MALCFTCLSDIFRWLWSLFFALSKILPAWTARENRLIKDGMVSLGFR
ncbi:MAG: hypothetical protein G01um10142_522 [Parcubacteria group bacterium Gr01-1014_2]|nr:MAG: hypothetical protein G01um10142_522 [Parcubacteria group bacterium Gr01-1014_2]